MNERAEQIAQELYDESARPSDIAAAMLAFAEEVRREERKRCAEIAENYDDDDGGATASAIARIIKQEPK